MARRKVKRVVHNNDIQYKQDDWVIVQWNSGLWPAIVGNPKEAVTTLRSGQIHVWWFTDGWNTIWAGNEVVPYCSTKLETILANPKPALTKYMTFVEAYCEVNGFERELQLARDAKKGIEEFVQEVLANVLNRVASGDDEDDVMEPEVGDTVCYEDTLDNILDNLDSMEASEQYLYNSVLPDSSDSESESDTQPCTSAYVSKLRPRKPTPKPATVDSEVEDSASDDDEAKKPSYQPDNSGDSSDDNNVNDSEEEISYPVGGPPAGVGGPPAGVGGPPNPVEGPPNPAGGPPNPAGGPPAGVGGPPNPAGGPPNPAGGPPNPAGGPPNPAGGPPAGVGGPPNPAGGPPNPAGGPPNPVEDPGAERNPNELVAETVGGLGCPYKCSTIIPQDYRVQLCSQYHKVLDYNRRKDFICHLVDKVPIVRRRANQGKKGKEAKARDFNLKFRFECNKEHCCPTEECNGPPDCTIRCEGHQVCGAFLTSTLSISYTVVRAALQNNTPNGVHGKPDQRGRHTPKHALKPAIRHRILHHIDSFPRLPSHYCRASSQKEYLEANLTIKKMYELFVEANPDLKKANGKFEFQFCSYQRIFCDFRNISFFRPKKDKCQKCAHHDHLAMTDPEALIAYDRDVYDPHNDRKKAVANIKKAEKARAAAPDNKSFVQCTFDLQAVLATPHSAVNLFYYKRKLNVYNFTVMNHQNNDGHWFVWPEYEARRGANEISTFLFKFLNSLSAEVNEVFMYCDNCAGQNKNSMVVGMMVYLMRHSNQFNSIQVTYLEPGHSQMEVDSMHAVIERRSKHVEIMTHTEWALLIQNARTEPYIVNRITHRDIIDFKAVSESTIASDSKIKWRKMKIVRFERDSNSLNIKYDYTAPQFVSYPLPRRHHEAELQPVYQGKLPISDKKKSDLMSLLDSKAIPSEYRGFYENIPSDSTIVDYADIEGHDDDEGPM